MESTSARFRTRVRNYEFPYTGPAGLAHPLGVGVDGWMDTAESAQIDVSHCHFSDCAEIVATSAARERSTEPIKFQVP
jgi:hypothetical protein